MAHWIIEDKGFGGTVYRCSDCRASWNSLFDRISSLDPCLRCGATMDEDKVEYVENKRTIYQPPSSFISELRNYQDMETKMTYLSGFSIEKLIDLFAAGYTLTPPNCDTSLEELAKSLDEERIQSESC